LSSIRLIKAGRFRSLVFFSPHRAPNFPDVPTTAEATGHKWHKGAWRGFDMIYLDSAGVAAFMNAGDEDNKQGAEVARAGKAGGRSPDERSDIRGCAKLSRMSLRSSGPLAVAACVRQAPVDAMKRLRD
jgi:hypothetical protein